jgi:hypothetical protein
MDQATQDRLQDALTEAIDLAHEKGATEEWLRSEFEYQVQRVIEDEGPFRDESPTTAR